MLHNGILYLAKASDLNTWRRRQDDTSCTGVYIHVCVYVSSNATKYVGAAITIGRALQECLP